MKTIKKLIIISVLFIFNLSNAQINPVKKVPVNVDSKINKTIGVEMTTYDVKLIPECCYTTKYVVMPGNPHTQVDTYVGDKYKMSGLITNSRLMVVSNGNTTFENFVNNGYTQCYKKPVSFTLVAATNQNPIAGATVNGVQTLNIKKISFACLKLTDYGLNNQLLQKIFASSVPEGFVSDDIAVEIVKNMPVLNLTYKYTLGKESKLIITAPLGETDGDLFISATPRMTQFGGGRRTVTVLSDKIVKKQEYVGHVTLLR